MPKLSRQADTTICQNCRLVYPGDALFCPNCGTAKSRDAEGDPLLGKTVGDRYLLIERIGQGTSGTIFKAEHVTLRRKVAVKVLHHELSRDDLAIERFRREATTVGELDNDHIAEIYDFGRTGDGRLYLAMEFLDGKTLSDVLIEEGTLSVEQTVDVLVQLGEALMEAHAMGYIHRDLRPRNIYLAERRGRANYVKLLDFGLAKLVEKEGDAASTSLGMTFGDPHYMSPEQARGDSIDRRADIYSLGCIAFEMLIGEPPFKGGKVFDVLTRHVENAPPEPISRRPDLPPWLNKALLRMLAKSPNDRFITVYRLVEALRQGTDSGTIMTDEVARRKETNPPPSVSRAMEKLGRRPSDEAEAHEDEAAPQSVHEAAPQSVHEAETAKIHDQPVGAGTVLGIGVAEKVAGQVHAGASDGPTEPSPAPEHLDEVHDRPAKLMKTVVADQASAAHAETMDGTDAEVGVDDYSKTVPRDPPSGKRRKRSSSSAGISAAWYADGEAMEDEGDALDSQYRMKLQKARGRRTSRSMLSATDEMYYDPESSRLKVVIGVVGGLAAVVLLVILLWPSGDDKSSASGSSDGVSATGSKSDSNEASSSAAGATPDAAPAAAPIDAAAAAATPPDAGKAEPVPVEDTTVAVKDKTVVKDKPPKDRPPRDRPPRDRPPRDPPPKDPPPKDPPPKDPPPKDPPPQDVSPEQKKKAEFHAKHGQSSLRSGDIVGAAKSFKKALELNPGNSLAITGRGEVALRLGKYSSAISHLKRAAKRRSRSARVHTLLGKAYLGAGKKSLAAKAFKKALKINPDYAEAREGYNIATGN